jgi:aromatic-amino-acid transaminase
MDLFRRDDRNGKLDLGVGVYRDDEGRTPIMVAVQSAEAVLLRARTTKTYLGSSGDGVFTDLLARAVLGDALAGSERLVAVQTPGGSGALRLGAELIARARPGATIWVGSPTWPNHGPILHEAGLNVRPHRFFDPTTSRIDIDGMFADLADASPGDTLLLHGCCHNPSGAVLDEAQWAEITQLCTDRGIVPFIDFAYHGLGEGLDADAGATRRLLERLPDALLAYSCSKNFGLYRDRVGALWVEAGTRTAAEVVHGHMRGLARSLWSMPPDHGAAIVRTILESPELREDWQRELAQMRQRIAELRRTLAAGHPALWPIAAQAGMFALLPLEATQVTALREREGIYLMPDGRINLCGLTLRSLPAFLAAIAPYLPS